MKIISLIFVGFIFWSGQVLAADNCFIAKENGKVLKSEGDCQTAYPPQSTFKVVLSLMGFDSGILNNETTPSWSMPQGEDPYINACKGPHNPQTWIRDSCLWYSRLVTKELGTKKFQQYVNQFSYGNQDVSGGLRNAWVSSSLKISPNQQTQFLQSLVDQKFSLRNRAYEKTKNIMRIQELPGGWKLYGKTGNGSLQDHEGKATELQQGWFVGYIEKGSRTIVFASHLVDTQKQNTFASLRAKNNAMVKLFYLIDEVDK